MVGMGLSELVVIALVGLALFGGVVKVKFKGLTRRKRRSELKDSVRKLLDE